MDIPRSNYDVIMIFSLALRSIHIWTLYLDHDGDNIGVGWTHSIKVHLTKTNAL